MTIRLNYLDGQSRTVVTDTVPEYWHEPIPTPSRLDEPMPEFSYKRSFRRAPGTLDYHEERPTPRTKEGGGK